MPRCEICEKPIEDMRYSYGSIYEPICQECHWHFADQLNTPVYGRFIGGDPRKFQPDPEVCTPDEVARWKSDCEYWQRVEDKIMGQMGTVTMVLKEFSVRPVAYYGVGVNTP